MVDITMCMPTKYLKKCEKCYRLNAYPSKHQSYANFYSDCKFNKYNKFIPMEKKK